MYQHITDGVVKDGHFVFNRASEWRWWLRSLEDRIRLQWTDKKKLWWGKGEKKSAMLPIKMELPPPLSITITQHRFSQLFGLSFQLLDLLQQSFMVGMLGPVAQERDRKQRNQHINFFIGCKRTQRFLWELERPSHCFCWVLPRHLAAPRDFARPQTKAEDTWDCMQLP